MAFGAQAPGGRVCRPSSPESRRRGPLPMGGNYDGFKGALVLWCFVSNPHQSHVHLTTRRRWKRNTNERCGPSHWAPATSSPRPPQNLTSSPPICCPLLILDFFPAPPVGRRPPPSPFSRVSPSFPEVPSFKFAWRGYDFFGKVFWFFFQRVVLLLELLEL